MQDETTSRLVALCFDANDPLELARFWAAALRWQVGDETQHEVGLVSVLTMPMSCSPTPRATSSASSSRRTTSSRAADVWAGPLITWGGPPIAPKTAKNRLHLDIAPPASGDQLAEVDRLISLGATRVDIGQGAVDWVVLADPDGNEFCVLSPR